MLQALREQRAAKAQAIAQLVKKDGPWTEADQSAYDAGMGEIESLDAKIKRIHDSNKLIADNALESEVIEAAQRIAHNERKESVSIFAKWLKGGVENLTGEELAKFKNTMSVGTNSQGGYTVETEVAAQVLEALKQFGGMRRVATVIQTTMGNPMNFPTSDGTSEMGEIVAENGAATAADPSFGAVGLNVYKFSSKIIAVPFELLQDSNVDVEAFVRGRMTQRIGRITNNKFTVGSGTGEPNGVVTACGTGKTGLSGQTATIIYDDLVDLEHAVDPAYRELGNCRYMMNDASLRQIRKIKDTTGRPIFVPGFDATQGGKPNSIPDFVNGYPVQTNQDVATMAANAKSVLFGDFSFYTIRDVMEILAFRFTDSVYTSKGQVGFLAWMRAGGNFVDVGGAVKAYANSAT